MKSKKVPMKNKKGRRLRHTLSQDEFREVLRGLLEELTQGGAMLGRRGTQRIHDVSFRLSEVRDHCYCILKAVEQLPETLARAPRDSVRLWSTCSYLSGMLWSLRVYCKLTENTLTVLDRLTTRLPPFDKLTDDEYAEFLTRYVDPSAKQTVSGKVEDETLLVRRLIREIKSQEKRHPE